MSECSWARPSASEPKRKTSLQPPAFTMATARSMSRWKEAVVIVVFTLSSRPLYLRLRNRTLQFSGGFNPLVNDDFEVSNGRLVRFAISGATRQFGRFCDETLVSFAPLDCDSTFA